MNRLIHRDQYIDRILPFIDTDIVKVLVGMRRSGKSVLMSLLMEHLKKRGVEESKLLVYNFESYQTIGLRKADRLYEEIQSRITEPGERYYLFFDEIQEVQGWERVINSLRVDFHVDIYITGSNAGLLSGELATYLAGRYIEIPVYPFSFKEFSEQSAVLGLSYSDDELFSQFIRVGGMPFLGNLALAEEPVTQYLRDLYNSVLLKDIIERNNIRDVELLERILIYIISNIGKTFSAKNISDYLKSEQRKVAPETVYNYIKACEQACLLHKVRRQDLVGKKILKVQEKIFITDHGLRQAIYGKNNQHIDQVLKNIIYMELLRRGYKITIGKYQDKEVDFVAEKGSQRTYFQVCYLLASEEVTQREFSVLENIPDNYPKYVLSLDQFDFSRNGIIHRNIRDFLLS
ncbi:MAG: ATP-binding protein [Sphaerochaetaceae bacterium]|nr:ATP-binding protein [Sphaerochaetaceae bacterium]